MGHISALFNRLQVPNYLRSTKRSKETRSNFCESWHTKLQKQWLPFTDMAFATEVSTCTQLSLLPSATP